MQEVQTTVQSHAGALQQLSSTVTNTEKAIGEVHPTLNIHQDELSDEMMNSFQQQYGKLEALLEKRHKTD